MRKFSVAALAGERGDHAPSPSGPGKNKKESHKKDGRRRQLHRFHVSWTPLTRSLDPILIIEVIGQEPVRHDKEAI